MSRRSYLRWPSRRGSWHVIALVDDAGWHLRCGKLITTDTADGSDHLPTGERSCESCTALTLRDEDAQNTTNDPVTPPTDVADDPVLG